MILVQIWCNTLSNGTLKTRRDNLCGVSCGANNSCRTPRIAFQFYKVQIYFDIQKALLRQGFLFLHYLSIVGVDVLGDPNESKLSGTPGRSSPTKSGRAVQFVKNPAVLFTFWNIYSIIIWGGYLLDKLEFDEENIQ